MTKTYQDLGKMEETGYRYEKFVQAEMYDNAAVEADKLQDISSDMINSNTQDGTETGFASEFKDEYTSNAPQPEMIQNKATDTEQMKKLNVKADELKNLSMESDKIAKEGKNVEKPQTIKGWEVIDTKYDKDTNFKAVVYQKGNEIVVSYVGTDFSNIKDWKANGEMILTGKNTQMDRANDFCTGIVKANVDKNIIVIGHSEGGSEAIYAGAYNNLPVITYNAYGVPDKVLPKGFDPKSIYDYKAQNDIISKARTTKGDNVMVIPSEQTKIKANTPIGWAEAHRIETMGDINKAIPKSQYRQENKSFLNIGNLNNLNMQNLQKSGVHNSIIQKMIQNGAFNQGLSRDDLLNIYTRYLLGY